MTALAWLAVVWLCIAGLVACIWWLFNAIARNAEWADVRDHEARMRALAPEQH